MNKLKFTSKLLITFLSLVLCTLLLLCIIPFKNNIDTTLQGIQWRLDDSTSYEPVVITVKGTYKQYILNIVKDDTFNGSIEINNYEITKNSEPQELIFSNEFATLSYDNKNDNYLNVPIYFGNINCTPSFSKIDIGVVERDSGNTNFLSWSAEDGLMITAPATNLDEAIGVSKEVSKFIWLNQFQANGY